ncbi:FliH/SctL family protein [Fervidobacterium sp.]
MIIKKRYVYLDAPFKIDNRTEEEAKVDEKNLKERENEILQMVAQANKEAEKIVTEAQNQAQMILSQAQEEYNKIIEEANAKATQILQEAEQTMLKEIENANTQIKNIITSFEQLMTSFFGQYCEKLASISTVLIEKFLEKNVDPEISKRKFEKIVAHLAGSTKVRIHINPRDAKLLDEETLKFVKLKGYEVVLNENVEHGVIAETDLGTIDSTLKFQFTLLDEIFDEIFKGEH